MMNIMAVVFLGAAAIAGGKEPAVLSRDASAKELMESCRTMIPDNVELSGRIILRNRRGIPKPLGTNAHPPPDRRDAALAPRAQKSPAHLSLNPCARGLVCRRLAVDRAPLARRQKRLTTKSAMPVSTCPC